MYVKTWNPWDTTHSIRMYKQIRDDAGIEINKMENCDYYKKTNKTNT